KIRTETRGPKAPGSGIPAPGKTTLWERLGGEKKVAGGGDDLVAAAAENKKMDFFRGGQVKLDARGGSKLKRSMVEMISQNTGGPLQYKGRDMKAVHKGMGITDEQFDALAADLKDALVKNGAQPADVEAVLKVVESTRKDIVEKKNGAAAPAGKDKLWDRLGGETGVARIVDAFVNEALKDKELNYFGDPDSKPKREEIDDLKKKLTEFISSKAEGPYPYAGKGMPIGTPGKKITPAQFKAIVKHLKNALEEKKVDPADAKPLLEAVESTRSVIVDETKDKDKKPGGEAAEGVVTLDGKPFTKGTITFVSEAGDAISGAIGADGTYQVMGLKPGKHKVAIQGEKKEAVPAKYANPDTSSLLFEVAAKSKNVGNFDLKSK